jgi:hypothetical protein
MEFKPSLPLDSPEPADNASSSSAVPCNAGGTHQLGIRARKRTVSSTAIGSEINPAILAGYDKYWRGGAQNTNNTLSTLRACMTASTAHLQVASS